jgi:hypothetical protein
MVGISLDVGVWNLEFSTFASVGRLSKIADCLNGKIRDREQRFY